MTTPSIILHKGQQEAYDSIKAFLKDDTKSIFILKGYAGTGKTTMISAIIPDITDSGKEAILLAPTGRAAKVLSTKTGHAASTIHSQIYSMDRIKTTLGSEDDKNVDNVQYWFGIKPEEDGDCPERRVFIIDEASMISSKEAFSDRLHFGTDILIEDLMTYAKPLKGSKLIFIGDPAQLPPVTDSHSPALEEEFFTSRGYGVISFELTEVLRQGEGSLILQNAMKIRDLLVSPIRNGLVFDLKDGEVEETDIIGILDKYIETVPQPITGQAVIICYSNSLAKHYNDMIRGRYFPGCNNIQLGDVLQVVKNHYGGIGTDGSPMPSLYNGDFVTVIEASSHIEEMKAPVWTQVGANKARIEVVLKYRDVSILTDQGDVIPLKIFENSLECNESSVSSEEMTAQYISFIMRNKGKSEEELRKAFRTDPYYNALHVKYGYAITGHKSQGGEWDTVFVDYDGRLGLNNDSLRWAYTATTRAARHLYGHMLPNIQPFSGIKIAAITKASKAPAEAIRLKKPGDVVYLPENATNIQKAKCLSVNASLAMSSCTIVRIDTLNYNDKYTILTPGGEETFDMFYGASGIYTTITPRQASTDYTPEILEALRSEQSYEYSDDYIPSLEYLGDLYRKMKSLCDDAGARITNVVEMMDKYRIVYHLKTSGAFSSITLSVKANGKVTSAMPSSDLGAEDTILNAILENLK